MNDKEKIEAIKDEIECRIDTDCYNDNPREELESLLELIDSLQEEPVSEDLEEAATKYAFERYDEDCRVYNYVELAFKAGANWQLKRAINWLKSNIDCDIWIKDFIKNMEG